MSYDRNTNVTNESAFSSTLRDDGSMSVSQSASGSVANNISIVVVAEKNGMPISARHFNIARGQENKLALGSEMLASMPDRVVFDVKVESLTPSSESGFGGIFKLGDPPVLFSVPPNSPITVNEMMSMVSYSQTRGILSVTLAPLWRRGYFPFGMAINLVDSATPGRISSVPKKIMDVYSESRAGNFFDSLDVEVKEGSSGNKILSVIENRREEIQEIIRTESTEPGSCGKPCVYHTAELTKSYSENGDVSEIDLSWTSKINISPSYNGFIVEDGLYSEPVTSNYSYRGNTFRQVSNLSMSMYNFDNARYAYDQLVVKKILSSGNDESRVHPLVEINDPFLCLEPFPDSSIPIVEIRNDVVPVADDASSFSSKTPYLLYVNAYRIKSSKRFAPAINFTAITTTENISLSINLLKENNKVVRSKNDIGLVFTTTVGTGIDQRSFTNFIRIKTSPTGGEYGSHRTYGSGDSLPDQGWPHDDVTVGDIYNLISNNIAGEIIGSLPANIDINSVDGFRGGQSCLGLIPTFAECGIISATPNTPVFSVYPGKNLSSCFGLPAHRVWLGNNDGSVGETATESYEVSVNNQQGSPLLVLHSRGPEKTFDLHNFTLAMPLARGSARAFLRRDIKEYQDHAADGDFSTLRANRFYPFRTISDAVDFIRHGSDQAAKNIGISDSLKENLYPSGVASGTRSYGERRPCIGASNIGLGIDYCCGNQFEPDNFYKQVGSYFLSSLAQTEPFRMTNSSVSLRISKFSRQGSGSIFACYSPGRMFNTPRSGFNPNSSNDIFSSAAATTGGDWHVLYSTLTEDYFGGIKYNDAGVSKYQALNPFIHGAEASLKSEGGLAGSSKRRLYVNPCVDFRGKAFYIDVANIGYDLDEFCRSTNRFNGNVQRFVRSENPGSIAFPVSGEVKGELAIRSIYPYETFEAYLNNLKYKVYNNTFGNLIESLNDSLGWSVSYTPSSILAREDKIPFESIRLELLNRPTVPEEIFPEPYGIEPYYVEPYHTEPYGYSINYENTSTKKYIPQNTVFNDFNPYIDPYAYEPYLEPYGPIPNPVYAQLLLRSRRLDNTECVLGYIPAISIVKVINDARRFDFNLNERKNRTIANLIQSIEDRLGPFGIHATSAVSNPESFISNKLVAAPRTNILETSLSIVNEIETIQIPLAKSTLNFDYGMNLFRFIDGDVYGYVIERCNFYNSIDNHYPKFPYTIDGSIYNCGDLNENINLILDVSRWAEGHAGKMFLGGAAGKAPDIEGKQFGQPDSPERDFAQVVSSQSVSVTSMYDIGDTARRSFVSGLIEPSVINKYQWFDFNENKVKGSNRYSIAAGYGGATFITKNTRKLDTPRAAYTVEPGSNSSLYDLIITNPSIWSLEIKNHDLIDNSNAYNIYSVFGSCPAFNCGEEIFSNADKIATSAIGTIAINIDGSLSYSGERGPISRLPTGNDFTKVAIGGRGKRFFGFACRSNGSMEAWGLSPANSNNVTNIPSNFIYDNSIVDVAAGGGHAVALNNSGNVICWGDNSKGQCDVPVGMGQIVKISAAQNYTMALNSEGRVFVWGDNDVTDANYLNIKNIPEDISGESLLKCTTISAGHSFAMALAQNGYVYCWGNNSFGQCDVPPSIQGKVLEISAGYDHALAIVSENNFIASWGNSQFGKTNVPSSLFYSPHQTPKVISAGSNYSVVITQGGKKAPIRELFSNDLDADGIEDVTDPTDQIRLISIDQSVDSVCVTLDEKGTVRIINTSDQTPRGSDSLGNAWNSLIYFDKDWIANGFLTDDEGRPVFIENKGFVSVCATSGLLGLPEYVWCIHENGKMYGVELTSARCLKKNKYKTDTYYFAKRIKFNSANDNSSGRNPVFGKALEILEDSNGNISELPNSSITQYSNTSDEFDQVFTEDGIAKDNGYCNDIYHALNLIPKINNRRFPVISVTGGYHTGGMAVCVNPEYSDYPSGISNVFAHPIQMCEVVKLHNLITTGPGIRRSTKNIQRYSANYSSSSGEWTYEYNNSFDKELYDSLFGVHYEYNNEYYLIYVPPRCVSFSRMIDGCVIVMGNNGNIGIAISQLYILPFKHDPNYNNNYLEELQNNKLNVKGDFLLRSDEFNYATFGPPAIFNNRNGNAVGGLLYKFGQQPEGESPASIADVSLYEFNSDTMFSEMHKQVKFYYGWGNPPLVDGFYPSYSNIRFNGAVLNNIFGFSYYDFFGRYDSESGFPEHLVRESNYINNSHIVKVIAYPDNNGNMPIDSNGNINPNYNVKDGAIWNVLSLADNEKMQNHFVWAKGASESIQAVRADGTIDILGVRNDDLDSFVFDPFWGAAYPSGRLNPSGVDYGSLVPENYEQLIESTNKIGSYIDFYDQSSNKKSYSFRSRSNIKSEDPYAEDYFIKMFNPYLEPYIDNEPYAGYVFNYIKKPKPVLSVSPGLSSFDVEVETIDPSFSGAFSVDFDFNVARRSTPSNSSPANNEFSDQRPRNDPAVRSIISGSPYEANKTFTSPAKSVSASSNPTQIVGDKNNTNAISNSIEEMRRMAVEDIIRRQK
jgi:hypothetical protein